MTNSLTKDILETMETNAKTWLHAAEGDQSFDPWTYLKLKNLLWNSDYMLLKMTKSLTPDILEIEKPVKLWLHAAQGNQIFNLPCSWALMTLCSSEHSFTSLWVLSSLPMRTTETERDQTWLALFNNLRKSGIT